MTIDEGQENRRGGAAKAKKKQKGKRPLDENNKAVDGG